MYNVTVNNNYFQGFTLDNDPTIYVPGQNYTFTNWGNHVINVPGMGPINFIDMGDFKLAQYTVPNIPWTNSTWGGLIRYRSIDVYFRYEGQGELQLTLDGYGSVQLSFTNGGGMVVYLDDMAVAQD